MKAANWAMIRNNIIDEERETDEKESELNREFANYFKKDKQTAICEYNNAITGTRMRVEDFHAFSTKEKKQLRKYVIEQEEILNRMGTKAVGVANRDKRQGRRLRGVGGISPSLTINIEQRNKEAELAKMERKKEKGEERGNNRLCQND